MSKDECVRLIKYWHFYTFLSRFFFSSSHFQEKIENDGMEMETIRKPYEGKKRKKGSRCRE
jgi:hypothetical protein